MSRSTLKRSILKILVAVLFLNSNVFSQQNSQLQKAVQQYIDSVQQANHFPGMTVSYFFGKEKPVNLATGLNDIENNVAMKPGNRMPAGSIGKTFFATWAMHLVKEGNLNLDDPISKYIGTKSWFSQLPNAATITVRQLMDHTSGIEEYYTLGDFFQKLKENKNDDWKLEDLIAYVLNRPALFQAGADFSYADTNYLVLELILESIDNKDAFQSIKENILTPLKLENTAPAKSPLQPDVTIGYVDPQSVFGISGRTINNGKMIINPKFEFAGGGFISNSTDLAVWIKKYYLGETNISIDTTEMHKTVPSPQIGKNSEYGLGIQLIHTRIGDCYGHGGWFPGYLSETMYFPQFDLAVAIQMNTDDFTKVKRHPLAYLIDIAAILSAQKNK